MYVVYTKWEDSGWCRYTDCWSTGWGSEAFPEPNIPVYYSDDLRWVNKNNDNLIKREQWWLIREQWWLIASDTRL